VNVATLCDCNLICGKFTAVAINSSKNYTNVGKVAKMQWARDPCQSNVDNLNSVRHEVSRHFRNKKKVYLRAKIEELETNNKINIIRDLYRGINEFKKGYQPRCNIVKDEKGDLVADSHSIVVRWRNYFSQVFNVHGVKDVGQAEPLVPLNN
jgi:hypothetical protein